MDFLAAIFLMLLIFPSAGNLKCEINRACVGNGGCRPQRGVDRWREQANFLITADVSFYGLLARGNKPTESNQAGMVYEPRGNATGVVAETDGFLELTGIVGADGFA